MATIASMNTDMRTTTAIVTIVTTAPVTEVQEVSLVTLADQIDGTSTKKT